MFLRIGKLVCQAADIKSIVFRGDGTAVLKTTDEAFEVSLEATKALDAFFSEERHADDASWTNGPTEVIVVSMPTELV